MEALNITKNVNRTGDGKKLWEVQRVSYTCREKETEKKNPSKRIVALTGARRSELHNSENSALPNTLLYYQAWAGKQPVLYISRATPSRRI